MPYSAAHSSCYCQTMCSNPQTRPRIYHVHRGHPILGPERRREIQRLGTNYIVIRSFHNNNTATVITISYQVGLKMVVRSTWLGAANITSTCDSEYPLSCSNQTLATGGTAVGGHGTLQNWFYRNCDSCSLAFQGVISYGAGGLKPGHRIVQ